MSLKEGYTFKKISLKNIFQYFADWNFESFRLNFKKKKNIYIFTMDFSSGRTIIDFVAR